MFLDAAHRFVDEVHERCFEANALDHIERRAVLPLRPFVFDEVDTATRVPKRRILGKKQQTGHVGSGWTPRGVHQMIGVSENSLRRPRVLSPGCQTCNGNVVQIVPCSVQRLVPFVKHGSFGYSESLDLLCGKRWGLSRDTIKRTSAGDTI